MLSRRSKEEKGEELTSRVMKAKIGERSIVPPRGGMMPLNKFKYGSQMVLHRTKQVLESRRTQTG